MACRCVHRLFFADRSEKALHHHVAELELCRLCIKSDASNQKGIINHAERHLAPDRKFYVRTVGYHLDFPLLLRIVGQEIATLQRFIVEGIFKFRSRVCPPTSDLGIALDQIE